MYRVALAGFVPNPWEPGQTDFELELVVDVGLAAWLQAERQTAKKRERDTQRAYLDFLCESGSTVECREYHIGKDEGRSGTRMSAGC